MLLNSSSFTAVVCKIGCHNPCQVNKNGGGGGWWLFTTAETNMQFRLHLIKYVWICIEKRRFGRLFFLRSKGILEAKWHEISKLTSAWERHGSSAVSQPLEMTVIIVCRAVTVLNSNYLQGSVMGTQSTSQLIINISLFFTKVIHISLVSSFVWSLFPACVITH